MTVFELLEHTPQALATLSRSQRNDPFVVRCACQHGGVFMFNHAGASIKYALMQMRRHEPLGVPMDKDRLMEYLDRLCAQKEQQQLEAAVDVARSADAALRRL